MGLDMYINDEYGNEVAYWRKFNALHHWFVKNCQNGVDNCEPSRILTTEDIEHLIYIMKAIKEAPLTSRVLLPTSDGFFFGSTAYDEYFMQDVEAAITTFENLLEDVKAGAKLTYLSSW
jgi:hypothetical protein